MECNGKDDKMTETASRLAGKVAVITGAGRGIGRAIAVGFAAEGASVCCAARTKSEIDEVARLIESAGGSALAVQADVTQLADVEAMHKAAAERFGGIDIVVVNAGGNLERRRIEDGDAKAWTATIDLNLKGAYYTAKSALPYLKAARRRQSHHHRLRHRTQRTNRIVRLCLRQGGFVDAYARAGARGMAAQHQRQ